MSNSSGGSIVHNVGGSALTPQAFRRTEIVGRGKFGVVYKAYHVKTKQVYAIKVLNLDCPEDEVEDVQKEVQFLSSLKQVPNITQYYGSFLYETKLWVIMEYCAGGSLRTLLRPGKIDEKYLGVIVRNLLVALLYIHKDNVIHRDIKAANVLITNGGHVKLCDFGVAAQLTTANHKRQTMAGTPYWMAPEVIMEGVYYNTKADIWSLGITTYEIATGNPPYCDVEALRAMQLITKSKPPRLEGRNYSPLLKEFIALCLDEDPEARPTAEELLTTKLVKTHKGSSVTILKELISRYLLFSEKHKNRESVMINLDDDDPHKTTANCANSGGADNQVEVKWDFDSLNSNEYIIQNDINIDSIPEETDWGRSQSCVNYAYPDEELYYESNKPPCFQGTTFGKSLGDPNTNTSTIQAYNQHSTANPSMGNQQGKNTYTISQSMKTETKASKQLLLLFEESEKITEEEENEFPMLAKSLSSMHLTENDTSASTPLGPPSQRQDVLLNGPGYHSQSTPILPILQTNLKVNMQSGPLSSTALTTPMEIEIPEELPLSTTVTAPQTGQAGTITGDQSGVKNIPRPGGMSSLQRRPTLSSAASAMSRADNASIISNSKSIGAELSSRVISVNTHISSTASSKGTAGNVASASSTVDRSPSPLRSGVSGNISPDRIVSAATSITDSANGNHSQNAALILHSGVKPAQSSNNLLDSSSQATGIPSVPPMVQAPLGSLTSGGFSNYLKTVDKEHYHISERASREFKRNNPNLKLQMPSPTTLIPNKLLISGSVDDQASGVAYSGGSGGSNGNINQFGINTSSTTNIPVAMTPLGEKVAPDFGAKLKRSTSTSNRAGASSTVPIDAATNTQTGVQSVIPVNLNTATAMTSSGPANGTSATAVSTSTAAANPGISSLTIANSNTSATNNVTSTSTAISSNTIIVAQPVLLHMEVPPKMLPMDMFVDVDETDDTHRVDRKSMVLRELDTLLRMFEDGLPIMENALKNVLPTQTTTSNDND
ncbi:putative serine/threonine protein kinase KIC1 Ecym_5505 [Eremothecium cymbalariae DBVPG|uniref:non-specific serine/threonine protein kinase n=1 Tax=Eremothecium cymbalariae (strain CBS 270.75 / DBVPG 7215 / KCTC 17166 / NRRL Y-17582) TaxID=931890 RepID=I6NDV6_ERECY|nr:hypothetical protein Ecym_5505 [Eremothecium cymbalariae DBVPG\